MRSYPLNAILVTLENKRKLRKPLIIDVSIVQTADFTCLVHKTPTMHVICCTEVQIRIKLLNNKFDGIHVS
jgi:hypothetical protein